jgi:hypothetical protein
LSCIIRTSDRMVILLGINFSLKTRNVKEWAVASPSQES